MFPAVLLLLVLFVPPKPPKAFEAPAVAVLLLPNTLPLVVVFVPNAVLLPPKGLLADVVAPNPEPRSHSMVSGDSKDLSIKSL